MINDLKRGLMHTLTLALKRQTASGDAGEGRGGHGEGQRKTNAGRLERDRDVGGNVMPRRNFHFIHMSAYVQS